MLPPSRSGTNLFITTHREFAKDILLGHNLTSIECRDEVIPKEVA